MKHDNYFLNKIFSIQNDGINHTQINLLGFKIKFASEIQDQQFYHHLPIQENKIVFCHHLGSYACNVKYITEEILKQKLPYDLVWVVNKNILKFQKDFPKNVRLVMTHTAEAYREYATAKIWVDSERRSSYISKGLFKRDGQVYIQTFHGSLGIKKTGEDRNDFKKSSFSISKIDSSQIDYLISNGKYTSDFFKRIFWNNGQILETGHPRNDVFFNDNTAIKEKVYKHFNIPSDKKIVMYAPTLREDKDITCYTLDLQRLSEALSQKFGGKYVVITRLHPLIIDLKDDFLMNFDNVIDATDYSDMQELLISSDVLITDYSSCIYDFMLSRKPGFIFATDVKKYDNTRGLYYPLTSTPFPVASTNDELVEKIKNFDKETYKKDVEEFLKGKGCIDDGHASERVVDLIKNIIAETKNKQGVTA